MTIYLLIIISCVVGYVVGSIPFALLIGKGIYKVDVRQYGSHNLGATNVARTLGIFPGILVLIGDMLKGGFIPMLMYLLAKNTITPESALSLAPMCYFVTGIFVTIGHSHPLFANFEGGKAVASTAGFFLFFNYKIFLIGLTVFIVVVLITKIVSISSISCAIVAWGLGFVPWIKESYLFSLDNPNTYFIYMFITFIMVVLLIYRHKANIERLLKGEEKKFKIDNVRKK